MADVEQVDPKLVGLILNNVADGVFTVDPEFRITYLNRAAEQITGYAREEAVGKPCNEVFQTPICGRDCPLRQSIRTGRKVSNYEIDIRTRTGKQQTISVSTAPLLGPSGELLGGVETFRDLMPLKALRREVAKKYNFQDIISKNAKIRQLLETLPNIAQSDATVLIEGRSGTGKDLFATAIHNISVRADGPLVKVNCGALPEALMQAELFAHASDPEVAPMGRIQAAQGGTLFLDEVAELPLSLQAKLVRVLEQGEYKPAGGDGMVQTDVRIVAATAHNLERRVAAGRFREDLFYRMSVIRLRIPDLGERPEDIPLLVDHFIRRLNHRIGHKIERIHEEAMAVLLRYPFPGNVRELENALEHAYVVSRGPVIRARNLPPHIAASRRAGGSGRTVRRSPKGVFADPDMEKKQLIEVLERNGWSVPRSAEELGVHRTTLWRRLKRLHIVEA